MVVFSSNKHLEHLLHANYWVMDGTFRSAPSIVTQIYAIHAAVNQRWFPLVIALMQRKCKESYKALFQVLKSEVRRRFRRNLAPDHISTDFEQAAISAAEEEFEDTEIEDCIFHLGQTFWRRMQGEGLASEYTNENNEQLRSDFRSLLALAFVPQEDVPDVFDQLAADAVGDLALVFDYVEDNYVRGRRRGRGRSRPMFPPRLWNCYTRVLEELPRTTNTCEAWHRRLNILVGKHHPSLFVFLDQIQEEVGVIDFQMDRGHGGESPPKKRKKYEDLDTRILRIVSRYGDYKERNDVLTYLRSIGHNLAGNIIVN